LAPLTAGTLDKENRQVLDNLVGAKYCFSELPGQTRLALPMGGAQLGLRRSGLGMARKWRRKPLKSLKTDSEMAIRQLAVAGKQNRSDESHICAEGPQALSFSLSHSRSRSCTPISRR
jgi:hypothetical protein